MLVLTGFESLPEVNFFNKLLLSKFSARNSSKIICLWLYSRNRLNIFFILGHYSELIFRTLIKFYIDCSSFITFVYSFLLFCSCANAIPFLWPNFKMVFLHNKFLTNTGFFLFPGFYLKFRPILTLFRTFGSWFIKNKQMSQKGDKFRYGVTHQIITKYYFLFNELILYFG